MQQCKCICLLYGHHRTWQTKNWYVCRGGFFCVCEMRLHEKAINERGILSLSRRGKGRLYTRQNARAASVCWIIEIDVHASVHCWCIQTHQLHAKWATRGLINLVLNQVCERNRRFFLIVSTEKVPQSPAYLGKALHACETMVVVVLLPCGDSEKRRGF